MKKAQTNKPKLKRIIGIILANILSSSRLLGAVFSSIIISTFSPVQSALIIGGLFATDFLDGTIAKNMDAKTKTGNILDKVSDKLLAIMVSLNMLQYSIIPLLPLLLEMGIAVISIKDVINLLYEKNHEKVKIWPPKEFIKNLEKVINLEPRATMIGRVKTVLLAGGVSLTPLIIGSPFPNFLALSFLGLPMGAQIWSGISYLKQGTIDKKKRESLKEKVELEEYPLEEDYEKMQKRENKLRSNFNDSKIPKIRKSLVLRKEDENDSI